MKAIRMKGPGGTEALEWVDLPDPAPGPGEALVEIAAAGVNGKDHNAAVVDDAAPARELRRQIGGLG